MFKNQLAKHIRSTNYKPVPSYESGDPWDWAIGRDIEAHELLVEMAWDYLRTGKKFYFWEGLPEAGNTPLGYEIMYEGKLKIGDMEISKAEMKAYAVFHWLSKYLEEKEYNYISDWIVEYQGERIGLGIYTPDMLYSFKAVTENDLKRNRIWMLKNMINHTVEYSGCKKVHVLAGIFGNCKKMTKDYERDRTAALTKKFGKYPSRLMERIVFYEHTGQTDYRRLYNQYQY